MLYPDFEELLQLGYKSSRISLAGRRRVRSIAAGDHESPFRGKGLEFQEVREYVAGDDVRNIDWRVTARTGKPHLKLFTEERERSVILCIDVNDTMKFGTRGTFKSIQAARAAAALGWAATRANNRVGAALFGNVPGGMVFYDPVRSRKSFWRMLNQLCDKKPYHRDPVALEDHLRYLNKAVSSGALVFIISDFIDIGDTLKKRISELHRKADVVLVSVNDPADRILPAVGPVIFTDGKSKLAVDLSDAKGRKVYERLWDENREKLKTIVQSIGVGSVALTTNRDFYTDLVNAMRRIERKGGGRYERASFTAA